MNGMISCRGEEQPHPQANQTHPCVPTTRGWVSTLQEFVRKENTESQVDCFMAALVKYPAHQALTTSLELSKFTNPRLHLVLWCPLFKVRHDLLPSNSHLLPKPGELHRNSLQENKRASEQASKQASQPASQPASKQASKHAQTASCREFTESSQLTESPTAIFPRRARILCVSVDATKTKLFHIASTPVFGASGMISCSQTIQLGKSYAALFRLSVGWSAQEGATQNQATNHPSMSATRTMSRWTAHDQPDFFVGPKPTASGGWERATVKRTK